MAVIPDDIQDISKMNPSQQIKTIDDYIKYMKEQLEFWGSNTNRTIINQAKGMDHFFFAEGETNTSFTGFAQTDVDASAFCLSAKAEGYIVEPFIIGDKWALRITKPLTGQLATGEVVSWSMLYWE